MNNFIKGVWKTLFPKKEKYVTILRKKRPKRVLVKKVKDLEQEKCSKMFLDNKLSPNEEVYVVVNENDEIDYRKRAGGRLEYRILSVADHEIVD
jgi:hypothetical protein